MRQKGDISPDCYVCKSRLINEHFPILQRIDEPPVIAGRPGTATEKGETVYFLRRRTRVARWVGARAAFPGELQPREWSYGESSCSRLAGWCTPSRAAARSVLDGRSPETLDTGCRPNKLNACARQTDPGDERAHGARLTRGSAASNDRTGTSLSSCSDLPLPPMAIKSSLLPV